MILTKEQVEKRFLEKTIKTNSCWIWNGCILNTGYGQMRVGSERHVAHRVAYFLYKENYIPPDMQLDHLCRNRACVNPDHLEVVNQSQNTLRANMEKGATHLRTMNDVEHAKYLLETEMIEKHNLFMARVVAIKKLRDEGWSLREIADVFDLSHEWVRQLAKVAS